MALMVQRYVSTSPDFAILSAFLSGIIILLFGLLNLGTLASFIMHRAGPIFIASCTVIAGFLVQFISIPVTAGFTSAAAITIASGQLKALLGIKAGSSNEFIESWINLVEHIGQVQLWDTVLGVGTIVLLLLLKVSVSRERRVDGVSANSLVIKSTYFRKFTDTEPQPSLPKVVQIFVTLPERVGRDRWHCTGLCVAGNCRRDSVPDHGTGRLGTAILRTATV